ncbi:MAG: phenylalanine--tRNA ligase subunit alpha, partial [Lachnospiraceae bacterium]|nr:phenylalanine--tRNA ligase subunit alpha [Lachnospiraceae bacterium]
MKEKLQNITTEALAKIEAATEISELNDIKVAILGKKGELTSVLKSMKDVAPEDRPKVGQMVNDARQEIEAKLEAKTTAITRAARAEKMKRETIDV